MTSAPWFVQSLSPARVLSFNASQIGVKNIKLGWAHSLSFIQSTNRDLTFYEVELDGQLHQTVLTNYIDIVDLNHSSTYQFRVRFFDGSQYSAWSDILRVKTRPEIKFFEHPYQAINIAGGIKSRLVSMEDNNKVYRNDEVVVELNRGDLYEFDSSEFEVIKADKKFYIGSRLGPNSSGAQTGNATWITSSWFGNDFYFTLSRYAPLKVKVFSFEQSSIKVSKGDQLITEHNMDAFEGHTFTLSELASYHLNSTGAIGVYIYGACSNENCFADPMPLLPASKDIIGIPSRKGYVSASQKASVQAYYSGHTMRSHEINPGQIFSVKNLGTVGLYREDALRLRSSVDIVANSTADQNGLCSAPFVPVSMLKRNFAINAKSEWIAIASDMKSKIELIRPDEVEPQVFELKREIECEYCPYKYYIDEDLPAGTIIKSDYGVQVWFEPHLSDGSHSGVKDETLLFGWD